MKRLIFTANPTPLFSDHLGNPFVFWLEESFTLIIRHGRNLTVILYEPEPLPDFVEFLESEPEILIRDYRGRVVASHLPESGETVIKRDGHELRFKVPGTPKHVSQERLDNILILSRHKPSFNQKSL